MRPTPSLGRTLVKPATWHFRTFSIYFSNLLRLLEKLSGKCNGNPPLKTTLPSRSPFPSLRLNTVLIDSPPPPLYCLIDQTANDRLHNVMVSISAFLWRLPETESGLAQGHGATLRAYIQLGDERRRIPLRWGLILS